MKTCEICCGARTIRLPVRRPLDVRAPDFSAELTASPTHETSRVFPCPACADSVHEDRVKVLTAAAQMETYDEYACDPAYSAYCREDLAHALAVTMLHEGLISFSAGPPQGPRGASQLVATVGVVAPAAVHNIQSRILAGAIDIVFSVAAEARRKITEWGSAYGYTHVDKQKAISSVDEAARKIIDQKTRQLQDLNSARMTK